MKLDPEDLELLGHGPGAWAASCEAMLSGLGGFSLTHRARGDGRKDASRYAEANERRTQTRRRNRARRLKINERKAP